ncbi:MAG: c-type cytochrome [Rhodocyclaceae bacterium]|jgi:sulfide dehydrogenase cytochrome subunit|nr:c-type cytochrome [Rhodocyclaceae bacterium]
MPQRFRVATVLCALGLTALSSPGLAAEDHAAVLWASTCYACHGPEGRSDGGMPSIAGLSADGLYKILIEFREGERRATIMHHQTRGFTDEQLRRIANVLGASN